MRTTTPSGGQIKETWATTDDEQINFDGNN